MDVAFLLDKYFKGAKKVSIDVFDAQTLNTVYKDVINDMTSHFGIEISILQALSYCLYETMDNILEYGTDFGTRDMGQKLRQKLLAERSVLVALQRRYKVIQSHKVSDTL